MVDRRDCCCKHFLEAMYDPDTQLSYHALIGTRKQSVSDKERYSVKVLNFLKGLNMKKKPLTFV